MATGYINLPEQSASPGAPSSGVVTVYAYTDGNLYVQTSSAGPYQVLSATGNTNSLTLATGTATLTPLILTSGTLNTTPVAGGLEFNGQELYFSAVASNRALILTPYYYRSNTATTLGTSGSWLGNAGTPLTTGVTLQANTIYEFEGEFYLSTSGTTSHTEGIGFAITLTTNNLFCSIKRFPIQLASGTAGVAAEIDTAGGTTVVMTGAITTAQTAFYQIKGSVSVATAGSFLPNIVFSAAPGGTSTSAQGAWFRLWPIGPAGQISVGTWS
jgi:hypothetical protein